MISICNCFEFLIPLLAANSINTRTLPAFFLFLNFRILFSFSFGYGLWHEK